MMNLEWGHGTAPVSGAALAADFPQRADFFDDDKVLASLADAAAEPAGARCELLNVWYATGKSLSGIYRVVDGEGVGRIYTLQFHRPDASQAAFAAARTTARNGGEVFHLAQWEAVAFRFPEDPALPGLRALVDGAEVVERVAPAIPENLATEPMAWSLLSYLPGERAAIRQYWPAAGVTLVGKMQANAAASHESMLSLWRAPGRRFGMAEPVAVAADLPARWERFVAGQRIESLLGKQALPVLLRRIMLGLTELHGSQLPGLRLQRHDEVLGRLQHKVLKRIAHALPDLAAESAAFAAELAAAARCLPQRPLRVIHGDLHTANVLLDDERVVFIDLDSLSFGDPAFDLALLGTRLALWAMNEGADMGEVARAVATLPAIYGASGGDEVPDDLYAWYVAALLVGRQVKTCIRHLAPALPVLAPRLLAAARAILSRGRVEPAFLEA